MFNRIISLKVIFSAAMLTAIATPLSVVPSRAASRPVRYTDHAWTVQEGRHHAKKHVPKTKMHNQTLTAVEPGPWGGNGIRLQVNEKTSDIEFDCGDARIKERLMFDSAGKFSAAGDYHVRRPGPEREGSEADRAPAKFTGKITGKNMQLEIILVDTGKSIGKYDLTANKNVRLVKCY